MVQGRRWLLAVLGAVSLGGCSSGPLVAITAEPGSCGEENVERLIGQSLNGHAPLTEDDYPNQLCDWDGAVLDAGARRRMTRSTTHYWIARAWMHHGDKARALAAYRRDLEGATTSAARISDRVEIAKLLSEAGEHEAALRELDACDEDLEGGRSSDVDDARAEVLVALGRRREAIAVLGYRPETWWIGVATQLRIGELWLEEGEPERARVAYEAALAHCEGHHAVNEVYDVRLGLIRVDWAQGHRLEALADLDQLLEGIGEDAWWINHHAAWRLHAEFQRELGKPWSAAASLRRAFELEHRQAEPSELARASHQMELAALHLLADRPDLAFSGFEAAYRTYARELGPLDRPTLIAAHSMGVTGLVLGDPELAMIWLRLAATGQEAASGEPYDHGRAWLDLGRAEQRLGLHAEAARSFLVALDLLGEIDHPRLTDSFRARMYRDAARAFLDMSMCDRAPETIDLAKKFYARIGTEMSFVELSGNDSRLEQLRRCWDGRDLRPFASVAGAEPLGVPIEPRGAAQQP
jgi:tetratricopeptide (TPR) repeat protein